jgi:hypothetical protein
LTFDALTNPLEFAVVAVDVYGGGGVMNEEVLCPSPKECVAVVEEMGVERSLRRLPMLIAVAKLVLLAD